MASSLRLPRPRLPGWIKVKVETGAGRSEVTRLLAELKLNTVCAGARCPNLGECFHRRTATFLIMGKHCSRHCKFCSIGGEKPVGLELDEPQRVAEAARRLDLRFVVVTSVTRDDLADGGAAVFAATIAAIREILPETGIEVLTPDFNGDFSALETVLTAGPTVFNHNLETVERLTPEIRDRATYRRSLAVLRHAAAWHDGAIPVKSGLMAGLGETDAEIEEALNDLREAGVTLLTIGQYLPPSPSHWPLARYVEPETFEKWREKALSLGFARVASAPLVRSSYHAESMAFPKNPENSEKNHFRA